MNKEEKGVYQLLKFYFNALKFWFRKEFLLKAMLIWCKNKRFFTIEDYQTMTQKFTSCFIGDVSL